MIYFAAQKPGESVEQKQLAWHAGGVVMRSAFTSIAA
jgi:hypothetical protein